MMPDFDDEAPLVEVPDYSQPPIQHDDDKDREVRAELAGDLAEYAGLTLPRYSESAWQYLAGRSKK